MHPNPPAAARDATPSTQPRSDWYTLGRLMPYFWEYRVRMAIALVFLIGAKVASVSVPLLL